MSVNKKSASIPSAILKICDFIEKHKLKIDVENASEKLRQLNGLLLSISSDKSNDVKVIIFDEYNDGDQSNQPLCLHLVYLAFESLDEADNFEHWTKIETLDFDLPETRQAYDLNKASYEMFMERYGPIPDFFSALDWQLNAGDAQLLRKGHRNWKTPEA